MSSRTPSPRAIVGAAFVGGVIALVVLWPRGEERTTESDAVREPEPAGAEHPPAMLRGNALASGVPTSEAREPRERPPLGASQYAIEGVVRDAAAGTALPGIRVQVHGPDKSSPESAQTDRNGRFWFVRELGDARPVGFAVEDQKWLLTRWNVVGSPNDWTMHRAAGATTELALWVHRVFHIRASVLDESRRPVARARYRYGFPMLVEGLGLSNFAVVSAETDESGRFRAGPFTEEAGVGFGELRLQVATDESMLIVSSDDHAPLRLDPRSIPFHDREDVKIVLSEGVTLAGVLMDASGKPLSDAVVAAEYGPDDRALRRGTRTNVRGHWTLKHLPARDLTIVAHAFDDDAKARRLIANPLDDSEVRLVAEPIRLSKEPRITRVLGVALVDVDDEIRAAYELPSTVHVMVFDSGTFPDRLALGRVEKGYGLLWVGEYPVTSAREVVERLLTEPTPVELLDSPAGTRRVVFKVWTEKGAGTTSALVDLGPKRTASLRATLESLKR